MHLVHCQANENLDPPSYSVPSPPFSLFTRSFCLHQLICGWTLILSCDLEPNSVRTFQMEGFKIRFVGRRWAQGEEKGCWRRRSPQGHLGAVPLSPLGKDVAFAECDLLFINTSLVEACTLLVCILLEAWCQPWGWRGRVTARARLRAPRDPSLHRHCSRSRLPCPRAGPPSCGRSVTCSPFREALRPCLIIETA